MLTPLASMDGYLKITMLLIDNGADRFKINKVSKHLKYSIKMTIGILKIMKIIILSKA